MKKVLFLSVACLFASVVFGQSTVIFDGEDLIYNLDDGAKAENHPWWGVGGVGVEVFTWVGNPDKGATIWRNNDNDAWAGGGITLDNLSISAYNKISIDISKRVSGEVQVELQDGDARAYLKKNYESDGTGAWQTLVFDIPTGWTHLTALLVAPHNVNTTDNPINFEEDNERHRMSWDNVKLSYETTTSVSQLNNELKIVSVQIYTLTGGFIGENIDMNSLLKGIYVLKSIDERGNVSTKKLSVK